jgi:hypothetical protein
MLRGALVSPSPKALIVMLLVSDESTTNTLSFVLKRLEGISSAGSVSTSFSVASPQEESIAMLPPLPGSCGLSPMTVVAPSALP